MSVLQCFKFLGYRDLHGLKETNNLNGQKEET